MTTTPRTKALPIDRLQADVRTWLTDRHHNPARVLFYTSAEWAAKGETMAKGAALHAIIEESELFPLLNTYWPDYPGDAYADEEDFRDLLASRGYFYELGYTWTIHFFPLDG